MESTRPLTIVTLDDDRLQRHGAALAGLDRLVMAEMGLHFSDEPWDERNFLYPVPGKPELSLAALEAGERVVAFWMASCSPHPEVGVYTHRVAVHPAARGRGVGRRLLEPHLARSRRRGHRRLSLSVSALNPGALRFYRRAGFEPLRGPELVSFVAVRGMGCRVVAADRIEEAGGHRKFVLARAV